MSQHGCPERLSNRSKFQEDSGSQSTMELLVETLTGTAFEMTVSPSDTIFAIKSKIFRVEGIPVSQQHLLYNLKELEDSCSLRELSIGEGARLRLVLGMRGGPVSTRRLPPPAQHHIEPWPDIERLFLSNRDEVEWSGGGCKVTVLVFRDGERVNMVRVKENGDGTYSPIDANKYSASLTQLPESASSEGGAGALRENAVTMGKMLELRRRMESLSLQRVATDSSAAGDTKEIQKTRSEEALPTHLRDEPPAEPYSHFDPDDCFAFQHDNCPRYSYECGFRSRYTLLPPIGARDERAPDADARHPPLQRRQSRREGDEAAILEECLGGEEMVRAASPRPSPRLQPVSQDYGELVGGCAWRGHSASALQLRAAAAPDHLDAPFSSSTSELENLKRNSRLLPGLSRARPREHLHLSDEGLHLRREPAPLPSGAEERLYMRRDNSQPTGVENHLYMRRDSNHPEDRLYNRRDPTSGQEDRLYNRKESQEDRLYNMEVPFEERLFLRELPHPPGFEDRLFMRREIAPCPPGFEGRLYMRRETTSRTEDRLYMRKEVPSQVSSVDRAHSRRERTPDSGERDRLVQKIVETEREVPHVEPALAAVEVKEKKIRVRCGWCKKRLSVATVHACRCGGSWCAAHRYAEVHGCAWDYKAERAHRSSAPTPAPLHPPKLPKI